ncbi:hypothetical protein CEXT_786981 [Caerostris extrusa]|uniref:Uncharacterized protein n=1 Tax=Caerostris extrusa TaxID=172846 RepID=A0AAV4QJZ1_CAEEX|nr:hypothetical protein CEXT_786981 [Caerostris extrusa]
MSVSTDEDTHKGKGRRYHKSFYYSTCSDNVSLGLTYLVDPFPDLYLLLSDIHFADIYFAATVAGCIVARAITVEVTQYYLESAVCFMNTCDFVQFEVVQFFFMIFESIVTVILVMF